MEEQNNNQQQIVSSSVDFVEAVPIEGKLVENNVEIKNPVGRPKKTLAELAIVWNKKFTNSDGSQVLWTDMVLSLAAEGASDSEIRLMLDISDDLWYRLIEEEEEFSRTIKKAKDLCQVWWEKAGRTNLTNKEFSYTGWYMNMKNRFGWKDKSEVDQKISGNLSLSALHDLMNGETKD